MSLGTVTPFPVPAAQELPQHQLGSDLGLSLQGGRGGQPQFPPQSPGCSRLIHPASSEPLPVSLSQPCWFCWAPVVAVLGQGSALGHPLPLTDLRRAQRCQHWGMTPQPARPHSQEPLAWPGMWHRGAEAASLPWLLPSAPSHHPELTIRPPGHRVGSGWSPFTCREELVCWDSSQH